MPGLQELTGRHALRTVKLKRKTKHETSKTDNNYSKSPPPLSTSLLLRGCYKQLYRLLKDTAVPKRA